MSETKKMKKHSKFSVTLFLRVILIFVMVTSLAIGIYFSINKFDSNKKLGSFFNDEYTATVSVRDINKEDEVNGQPNGDAVEAAKVINKRLNPIGMKDIKVEIQGRNFLKISAPVDNFKDEREFKNQIQKSGGIMILDQNSQDIQWKNRVNKDRSALNDYFTSAEFSIVDNGLSRDPSISYSLNENTFLDLITQKSSGGEGQEEQFSVNILTDVDILFDDIRNYFNYTHEEYKGSSNEVEFADKYYQEIIEPLREYFNKPKNIWDSSLKLSDTDIQKILFDMFYGSYQVPASSSNDNLVYRYGSLVDSSFLKTPEDFKNAYSSFSFLSETQNYVYDPNTTSKDFESNGKYGANIKGFEMSISGAKDRIQNKVDLFTVDIMFDVIMGSIFGNIVDFSQLSNDFTKHMSEFTLYTGPVSTSDDKSANAFFSNGKFITKSVSQTAAQTGAAIFEAAGRGFIFNVNNIFINKSKATELQVILAVSILLLIALLAVIFVLFLYRIMGLITILIAAIIASLVLVSTSWFGLTIGPETFAVILILISINFEINISLFESMKYSYFLKKRGLQTSFKIANKENIGTSIDVLVSILIPSIVLFWIGESTLKSFAVMVTLGSLFTIIFSVLVCRFLYLLMIKTNIFESKKWKWLLALNTVFENHDNFIINYKIKMLTNKIEKLENKDIIPEEKISNLKIKLNSLENKKDILDKKSNDKLNLKEEKITLSYNKKIDGYKNKIQKIKNESNLKQLNKLEKKIDIYKEKISKIDNDKSNKNNSIKIAKINIKIKKLEKTISDLKEFKFNKKIMKIENKIDSINFILEGDKVIPEIKNNIVESTKSKKIKDKLLNNSVFNGTKIISLISSVILVASLTIGLTFGIKYDSSFGNTTQYTIWGDAVQQSFDYIGSYKEDEDFDSDFRVNVTKWLDYYEKEKQNDNNPSNQDAINKNNLLKSEVVGEFFKFIIDNPRYTNQINNSLNSSLRTNNVDLMYGINFNLENSSTSNDSVNQPWVSLNVGTINPDQSRQIRRVIGTISGKQVDSNIDQSSGFISKHIWPYSVKQLISQLLWASLWSILALIVYILIRFKWTYYIAIAISVLLSSAITIATNIIFVIPFGLTTIISFASLFLIAIIMAIIVFGKSREIMDSKDIKSMNLYFNKEIEISLDTKNNRKIMRDDISLLKKELKFKLKDKTLELEEKNELKNNFKSIVLEKKMNFKDLKKQNNRLIKEESKRNNYLREVMLSIIKKVFPKITIFSITLSVLFIVLSITIPTFIWLGISLIIGLASIVLTLLFVGVPIWTVLEQIRIRNKLTTRKFINNLEVYNEEQIIENIND